jgi:hypothetical protein
MGRNRVLEPVLVLDFRQTKAVNQRSMIDYPEGLIIGGPFPRDSRRFVPGYYHAVPPGQKPSSPPKL